MFKILKSQTYKGKAIEVIMDAYYQKFAIIDGDLEQAFDSVAEAKRYINGEPLKWEIVDLTK